MKVKRVYGGPFRGYISTLPKHRVPPGYMTADSRDFLVVAAEGILQKRRGSGQVSSSTGALEAVKWGARSRKLFALKLDSAADLQPTVACVYGRDEVYDPGALGLSESGRFGTVYWRSTNGGGTDQQLGKSFGDFHYPTHAGSGINQVHRFRCVPYWYDSGEGGYARAVNAFQRRLIGAGSRSANVINHRLYLPNFSGTPMWTDLNFNDSAVAGDKSERYWPQGMHRPLHPPTLDTLPGANADGPWKDGDTYYISVLFQRDDGAYGPAFEPRGKSATLTAGLGLVLIGTAGGANRYRSVSYKFIPKPPPGYRRRVLLRSNKQNLAAASDPLTIDPAALKIIDVLDDPDVTTYVDARGTDTALVENTTVFRNTHESPPRARVSMVADSRLFHLYAKPSTQAIMLAPASSTNADYDLNHLDDAANIYGSQLMVLRLTESALVLRTLASAGAVPVDTSISLSGLSLQDLVDTINATARDATHAKWVAQLCPGASGSDPATSLCPSVWSVTNCVAASGASQIDTTGTFDSVPLGYRVTGHASIPAGSIVIGRLDTNSLIIGDGTGAAVVTTGTIPAGTTLEFWADCGDDPSVGGGTNYGNMRAFAPTFPVVLHYRRSKRERARYKQEFYFTACGPADQALGSSLAPDMFLVGNRNAIPTLNGHLIAGGELPDGALLGASGGIFLFQNRRGGTTGEDSDYRRYPINKRRGMVSPYGFVEGDGWVGYPTAQGYVCFSSERGEVIISRAIHNSARQTGSLIDELKYDADVTGRDQDLAYFHAALLRDELSIALRSANAIANSLWPDRRFLYDFAPSASASGMAELLDPNDEPWGWSAPLSERVSAMCIVNRDGVENCYGAVDDTTLTRDGKIIRFDLSTSIKDAGTAVAADAYLATDLVDTLFDKGLVALMAVHNNIGGKLNLTHYRDIARTSGVTVALTTASGVDFYREPVGVTLEMRPRAAQHEFRFSDDGTGSATTPSEIHRLEADFEVTNVTTQKGG